MQPHLLAKILQVKIK